LVDDGKITSSIACRQVRNNFDGVTILYVILEIVKTSYLLIPVI